MHKEDYFDEQRLIQKNKESIDFLKIVKSKSRHSESSFISSLDDDISTQNPHGLIQLVASASIIASRLNLRSDPNLSDSKWFNIYPGEHYRLLAALIILMNPRAIVDVGTYTDMSARIALDYAAEDAEISTFDIISYDKFDTHLNTTDFNKNFRQHAVDLALEDNFNFYRDKLDNADIIFLDGPKNAQFELSFLGKLTTLSSKKEKLLILDDIRFDNMWEIWRDIDSPKFDATSFGHWSGTGLVDISNVLRMKD